MTKCVFDTFQSHERSGKVLISSDALAVWHISLTRIITSVVLRRIEQIALYNVSAGATTRKNTGFGGLFYGIYRFVRIDSGRGQAKF